MVLEAMDFIARCAALGHRVEQPQAAKRIPNGGLIRPDSE
jgi:hypothetical protein